MEKKCVICHKVFEAKRKDSKVCSDECKREYDNAKKRKTYGYIKCKNCGKIFLQKKKNNVFCCNECKEKYHNKDKRDRYYNVNCDYCGKSFIASRDKTDKEPLKFCCKKCGDNYRKEHSDKAICPVCKKEFVPYKSNHKYCSRLCRDIDTFRNTESEEFKKSFVEHYTKGKPKVTKMTKPHQKIDSLLYVMKVFHKNEIRFGKYTMDIILSDTKGIEIMGRYWHKDSRYYSKDIFTSLRNKITIEKDIRKNKKMEEVRITILYLWEDDINNNLDLCEQLIKEFVNNTSLQSYHSSAYTLINGELIFNPQIKQYIEKELNLTT